MDERALLGREARHQLVEDVVVTLARRLRHDARLLKQVDVDARARHLVFRVELDLDELAKSGRVVVPQRARVAEGLEQWVGREHLPPRGLGKT